MITPTAECWLAGAWLPNVGGTTAAIGAAPKDCEV